MYSGILSQDDLAKYSFPSQRNPHPKQQNRTARRKPQQAHQSQRYPKHPHPPHLQPQSPSSPAKTSSSQAQSPTTTANPQTPSSQTPAPTSKNPSTSPSNSLSSVPPPAPTNSRKYKTWASKSSPGKILRPNYPFQLKPPPKKRSPILRSGMRRVRLRA